MSERVRLWLDDLRPAPPGWVWIKTVPAALSLLRRGLVSEVSLDHDLGEEGGGTGYDVACFIEQEAFHGRLARLRWAVHSANPVGKERMQTAQLTADVFWDDAPDELQQAGGPT